MSQFAEKSTLKVRNIQLSSMQINQLSLKQKSTDKHQLKIRNFHFISATIDIAWTSE